MSEKARLTNRIVGSVIIFVAAIIILPSILDGEKISYKDEFKTVPARPEFETVQNNKPFPQKAFEQNMPQSQPITDETPVDVEELTASQENASAPQVAQESQEVLSTETLTVSTMTRPTSFDTPAGLEAKQAAKQAAKEATVQSKPTAKPETKKTVVKQEQQTAKAKKQSPFTQSAWVIQLGSFGLKANALAIEKKLNDAGFTTFSRQINSSRGPLTKVYVGPELDKKILTAALPKVNKIANVNGLVTSFTIRR